MIVLKRHGGIAARRVTTQQQHASDAGASANFACRAVLKEGFAAYLHIARGQSGAGDDERRIRARRPRHGPGRARSHQRSEPTGWPLEVYYGVSRSGCGPLMARQRLDRGAFLHLRFSDRHVWPSVRLVLDEAGAVSEIIAEI